MPEAVAQIPHDLGAGEIDRPFEGSSEPSFTMTDIINVRRIAFDDGYHQGRTEGTEDSQCYLPHK